MRIILVLASLIIVQLLSFGQNNRCDSLISCKKQVLWTYDTDSQKKLYYELSYCKHNGLHKSTIEITKSDENDTTEIRGMLKTDIGSFDINGIDSTVASYNYQNGQTIITRETNEKQSISIVWEKWFGMMRFDLVANKMPKISFDGKCVIEDDGFKSLKRRTQDQIKEIIKNEKKDKRFRIKVKSAVIGDRG